ncbi:MAG: hypothetical protein KJO44_04280, partial [Gemmatimonadetes bacterium]|nr:hypothetical protein [Gemmatimonadota bacterium]
RRLEDRAIAEGRGLWGLSATSAALAVAQSTIAIASAEEPGSWNAGGGSSGRTALPPRAPRRVGGG